MSIPKVKIAAPPGARAIIIRGPDPAAVAKSVRALVGDGLVLPAGPYHYPYAGIIQLLREAGLFEDPTADTADDVLVTREALCDLLWIVLRRGGRVGVSDAGGLDDASTRLLAGFAAVARLAAAHGHNTGGLVIGASGEIRASLQLADAEVRAIENVSPPLPALSRPAERVLSLMRGAPHPVQESSLIDAADIGARRTYEAVRELKASDLLEVRGRIALGACAFELEPAPLPWLETPEVRLPLARLAVQSDCALARHLAQSAATRGDFDIVAWCMSRVGVDGVDDALLAARAAMHCGKPEVAKSIAASLKAADLPDQVKFELARLQALLAAKGLATIQDAEAALRAVERAGFAVAARPWRARLLTLQGKAKAALTLLRRTTKAELRSADQAARIEHEVATVSCLHELGERRAAARHVASAMELCTTRLQLRALSEAGATSLVVKLALQDFDADAVARAGAKEVTAALAELMGTS